MKTEEKHTKGIMQMWKQEKNTPNGQTTYTTDTIFDTPLHVASGFGCLEMVEMLIRKGADIEAKDYLARTPLHLANEKTTEILIQMGAKLDAKDNRGDTPIHTATNPWNDSSKVLMLMRYGASLKIRNQDGLTPLECVLKGGSIFSFNVRMPHFKVILYNEMMWMFTH